MAMLTRFENNPNKNNADVSCKVDPAEARSNNVNGYNNAPVITDILLPKRDTSQPEIGRLIIKPTGNANNTPPRPASLKCNLFWMSGMRLAHVAKVRPATKKKTLVAIR